MKIFILLLFQLTLLFASAQRSAIDSLKKELTASKPDTNKVILLAALSYQYLYLKSDSSVLVAQEGYELARQLNFHKGEALCLNRIATANLNMGNSSKALELLQKARTLSEKINDFTGVGRSFNNIANFYMEQNEYSKALEYLEEAKKVEEINRNKAFFIIVLENIGDCYYHLNRLDSTLKYTQKAYQLEIQNNVGLLGDILRILGDIQMKKGNQKLALQYYYGSIAYTNRIDDL